MKLANSKNYEKSQVSAMRHQLGDIVGTIRALPRYLGSPIYLIISIIALYQNIGSSFLFGLSLLLIC